MWGNSVGNLKTLFYIVATAIFLYQSMLAILRYIPLKIFRFIESPTVVEISEKSVKEISKPRIFFCETDNGFNYDQAEQFGYEGYGEFLQGEIMNQPNAFTWVGNTSLTWASVQKLLFEDAIKDFIFKEDAEILLSTPIRLFPLRCFEIQHFGKVINIKANRPMVLYFSDPYRQPSFHLIKSAMLKDPVMLGLGKFSGESSYYEIQLSVTEQRQDLGTCTVYNNVNEYLACENQNLIKYMKDNLGCIPPWMIFNDKNPVDRCESLVKLDERKAEKVKTKLKELTENVKFLHDNGFRSDQCKPSCNKLSIETHLTTFSAGNWSGYHIHLLFNNRAKLNKEINAYNIFNLCVEVGSSLGLWLGLSAMTLLDLSFFSIKEVMEKFKHVI